MIFDTDPQKKSIATGSLSEHTLEEGFSILKFENPSSEIQSIVREVDSSYIQFHYCLNGALKFWFNDGRYAFDVANEHSLLLYNPQRDLPLNVELQAKSKGISLLISIKKFHALFSQEADYIHFLRADSKDKKYYDSKEISPSIIVVLNQIVNNNVHHSIEGLFLKAKAYELLSHHFNRSEDADIEQCPFLIDEQNVIKIRQAKDIVIQRMTDPPGLHELANEVGLTLKKLKEGFKQIYGDSVYSFLFDYKMEYARKLLASNKHNVNEVGHKIGYSTSSHFIAAFKKKYGTTPKKYIQSILTN